VATARRRTVSALSAVAVAGAALVVGFGAGYAVRKATSTTTTSAPPPSTTTSAPSSTSTTLRPLAPCSGAALTGSVASSQGAAGTITTTVRLTNGGATACRTDGVPTLQLLDANSHPIPTTVLHGHGTFPVAAANARPRPQRVTVGGTTTFMFQYSDVPAGTQTTCPQAAAINVYPPGSATPVLVTEQLSVCDMGTVYVSPLYGAT
jgi:hypothetical protein